MASGELQALSNVPLFSKLSRRHLQRILKATEVYAFSGGHTIIREGALGESFFVILEGTARVIRRGRTVASLGPGDFFGEISLLDGGPRTATVTADGPVRCLVLLRDRFEQIVAEEPQVGMNVLTVLAGRLRDIERIPTA